MKNVIIGPSILTADLLKLGDQLAEAERAGVDFIHFDVMDGRFVPNISFGIPVLEAVSRGTDLPVDVHLMIAEPDRYVRAFAEAGADAVTVHAEACVHLHATLTEIRNTGAKPGVSLNPATPIEAIAEVVDIVDEILIMSVNPGFGGQQFIQSSIDRIERVRKLIGAKNPDCRLAVDGGIKPDNVREVVEAGADMLIAGSAIFGDHSGVAESVSAFRTMIASSDIRRPHDMRANRESSQD